MVGAEEDRPGGPSYRTIFGLMAATPGVPFPAAVSFAEHGFVVISAHDVAPARSREIAVAPAARAMVTISRLPGSMW